ncbi:DNA gyrase inhibitor YacG [Phenylobacterium sp.]|uniref:DNA gyrase inhibitor YacG n=1 Tax=Phenylobacterium sp. TaxID=1871053 RepID=UPI00301C6650
MSCPICGKPPLPAYRPFCSKRCADVDLQRWLTGAYAVPAQEDESGPSGDLAGGSGDD